MIIYLEACKNYPEQVSMINSELGMFQHCESVSAYLSCLFRQIGKSVVVLVDITGQKRTVVVFVRNSSG